jgi:cytoskeletal protein CcmA (bactofilin family)
MRCANKVGLGVFWVAGSLALAGCGGGSGGGGAAATPPAATEQPVVAVGRIDAFGSVFVNGIEYETDRASYRIDDHDAFDDSALSVGMIVRVRGTSDDSRHGTALEIRYDDEVEGLVTDLAVDVNDDSVKRFKIFGIDVVANAATVFRGRPGVAFAFADLANGDHVEVSGDFDGSTLIASFIKLEDGSDDDFEAKGTVSSLNGSTFVLTLRGGTVLNATLAAGVVVPAGLADGSFVEVEGTVPDASAPNEFLVRRIEIEDHRDLDGDGDRDDDRNSRELDIEGVLSVDGTTWTVRDTELNFLARTEYRPTSLAGEIAAGTAAGKRVRVRGPVVEGVLQVERIRVDGAADGVGNLEVKGYVESVTSNGDGTTTVEVSFAPATGTVDVLVNAETLLMNDDGVVGLDLMALRPDVSFVEVHGRLEEGMFVAGVLKVEDRAKEYEIEGPLDAGGFVANVSISVLGVTFMLDAGTVFEDGTPSAGRIVDVEDFDRDGFADNVDIED